MKPVRIGILGVLLALTAAEARDLNTVSGDSYRNVSLSNVDATGITIMHDEGIVFLDFKNLPEAQQKEFGYDPNTYANGWLQKFAERAQRELRVTLAAQQAANRAKALEATGPATQQPSASTNTAVIEYSVDTPGFTYGGYPVSNNFPIYGYGGSPVYGGYPYYGSGGYCPPVAPIYGGGYGGTIVTTPRGPTMPSAGAGGSTWRPAGPVWRK